MSRERFFAIPTDQETMIKLVEAVPSDWSRIDGTLNAPEHLINTGEVIRDRFSISRFHTVKPTIVGRYNHDLQRKQIPDLFAIMVEQKLPW